jgi:ABC-type glycerol-3-phosphate transport system substrate-binding protein
LAAALAITPPVLAEAETPDWMIPVGVTEPSYSAVFAIYKAAPYTGAPVVLNTGLALKTGDTAEITVDAPVDGLYEIRFAYQNEAGLVLPSELRMTIDGEIRFSELLRLKFESLWMNTAAPALDRYGNEMPSLLTASSSILEKGLEDSAYRRAAPFLFQLSAGPHTLGLTLTDGELRIRRVTLAAPETPPPYTGASAPGTHISVYEGESFTSANNPSVHATGEYTPILTPYSASSRVLNFLDDAAFARAGDSVSYTLNAPETGWYALAFRYRQSAKPDFPVFCDIKIDGATPSLAARSTPFHYTSSFTDMALPGPDGAPQRFYLEAGAHTLTLTISAEPMLPVYEEITVLLGEINALTTEIVRLTGGVTTDRYRDYKLEDYIPGVKDILLSWAGRCDALVSQTLAYSRRNRVSSTFSSLAVCAGMLRTLAKKPEDLPRRLGELSQGGSSVTRYMAQVIQDMDNNALGIDRLFLLQDDAQIPRPAGPIKAAWEAVKRFFVSFVKKDYATAAGSADHLQVWMARPRQYVELLQNMIDTGFTVETGIKVDLSIMPDQGKLALAAAAGKAPDVALSVGYVLPSYLSIRGALLDLKRFDNFGAVAARFPQGLFIPGILEDGVYAMPETVNFWVLFYRTDIFEALNLPVPDDLDEVKAILPELQRRSMNFYYPTAGMGGMKTFPATMPLIAQNGGGFFGGDIGRTTLDSERSLEGFKELTELFTVYNMPVDAPAPGFYQQFRSGSMPIGISDVGTYNLLLNAAPELDGMWALAPFPGISRGDGTVLRYTTGGAESDMIFSATSRPDDAWAFLEWWSRDDVQARYGSSLRSLYGRTYLWNTANKAAFAQLPVQADHKRVILEQTDWMIEVPWVPGTYMVERELSNAYNSVVVDGVSVRRAMDTAVKRIDREVLRKLEEFGYMKDGQTVRVFPTPDVSALGEKRED